VRIATFNVENLFSRPVALNFDTWEEGKPVLAAHARFNQIVGQTAYSHDDKSELLAIMNTWGLTSAHANSKYFWLRDIRGDFARYASGDAVEIKARGRSDWIGWLDLKRETFDEGAIRNTARVIADVDPDILLLVEVEDRITLQRFYDQAVWPLLKAKGSTRHQIFMLVDGNDPRGIDIGLISRYPLVGMRSNVHRRTTAGSATFPRDCIEFYVDVGKRNFLGVLGNHFTSRASDRNGKRRREQAAEVAAIVDDLKKRTPWIVVAGDLNDHPASGNLDALVKNPEFTDVMAMPLYAGRPGTYKTAAAGDKLDYLFVSQRLKTKVKRVDVNRRGYFSTLWQPYEDIQAAAPAERSKLQASDHHCVWADLSM
jgi:endonuclease/exonuclease/phosphatase family metal-dependent hydrolase